ncbi:hypothetical protein [Pontibacter russatus]|uniref:hypothetical protein n=1 Tax=Pontibacter russatus TaxID=2694929 RepID=UPI00137983DB|nr:hypothetical protein [Pontibacter russatus]
MARNVIIRKRSGGILFFEIFALSIFLSVLIVQTYKINWAWGVVAFIVLTYAIVELFFRVKVFRYIFSVLFSMVWGAIVFSFTKGMDEASGQTSGLIMGSIGFLFGLWAHRDEFRFNKDAKVVNVERR